MAQPSTHGDEDRLIDVYAADVPPAIRHSVLAQMEDGDALWRCPRLSGSRGRLGFGRGTVIIEWWLISAEGELIEAFWEA